ncbi:MAG: sugar phosphate isomerase/epimerase family protein [Candidatus Aminicenantaceae bacterium]
MKTLRVGIDSYSLYPLQLSPLAALKWARENGAEGVLFSGLSPEERKRVDEDYLKEISSYAASNNLYLEWGGGQHIPFDMKTWEKKDIFGINRRAAEEAVTLGARIIRSCSGGLMRWESESPMTETLIQEMAVILKSQRQMLKDHNAVLAIETHFEFTTHELLKLFEQCEAEPGDYLGICLDTMNLLTMLEEPVRATERILPWVVSAHIKDGSIILNSEGLVTFPVEIGKGIVNLRKIAERLSLLPWEINLSVEDHGGSFKLPIYDPLFLSKFPDLTLQEFMSLVQLVEKSTEDVKAGKISILEREKWPEVCEARLKEDIRELKELI